jgi:hypothetical protein
VAVIKKKPLTQQAIHDPALYENMVHKHTYVIIYDIFSPPVASRIYAYYNLAAMEVLANEEKHFATLEGKVKGLNNIPHPASGAKIDYQFASIIAFLKVGWQLTFSSITGSP